MKRVLSVQHYPKYGGPHNEIVALHQLFRDAGYETVVAITDEPGSAHEALEPIVETHQIQLDRLHGFRDMKALARTAASFSPDVKRLSNLIRTLDIDLVRVHGAHNPQGALAARRTKTPLVWVLSSDIGGSLGRSLAATVTPRMADAVLITGQSLKNQYRGIGKFPNIFTYYAPANLERFRLTDSVRRSSARVALGIDPDRPVIGTIATLSPQKDPILFARVAVEMAHRQPEVQFVLVGGAAPHHQHLLDEVHRVISDGGVADRVHLTGERRDVPEILGAFDIMLITSRFEGTATTVAEALACGIPVVASDVGAVRDVVIDGKTGFVVDRTVDSFCLAIEKLLADPEGSRHMGEEGRQLVLEISSAEASCQQQLLSYEWALRQQNR
jgi:glycosyltransferase involved in cell wall biosynthesis